MVRAFFNNKILQLPALNSRRQLITKKAISNSTKATMDTNRTKRCNKRTTISNRNHKQCQFFRIKFTRCSKLSTLMRIKYSKGFSKTILNLHSHILWRRMSNCAKFGERKSLICWFKKDQMNWLINKILKATISRSSKYKVKGMLSKMLICCLRLDWGKAKRLLILKGNRNKPFKINSIL